MFAILSLYFRYTSAMLSLYVRYTFAILSLHVRYTPAILSLYVRYTFATLSIHFRSVSIDFDRLSSQPLTAKVTDVFNYQSEN